MPTRQRTISYLRAVWDPEADVTLEEALTDELAGRPTAPDTRIDLGDRSGEVRHRHLGTAGVRLHVAVWTAGEEASTVPHTGVAQADLAVEPPAEDWDYLNGDGMVLVKEDHCLLMPSGLAAPTLQRYLSQLLEGAGRFHLRAIGNAPILQQIRQEGVKRIDLDVSQYMETAQEGGEQHATILQRVGRAILASLIERDEDRRAIEEADNVHARLVINLDTRQSSGLSAEELGSMLAPLSEEEQDDGLTIETGSGQRFKRGQLVLRKPVEVESFGQTIHHGAAWEAMVEYLSDLRHHGALTV